MLVEGDDKSSPSFEFYDVDANYIVSPRRSFRTKRDERSKGSRITSKFHLDNAEDRHSIGEGGLLRGKA